MTNAEKFQEIFKKFATEVWAFPEKDFLTWLNAEYKEPTTRNCFGCKYSKDNHNSGTEECHLCMWENQYTPTTKNDLGVDCIDRAELLKAMNTWDKFGYTTRYGLERLDKDDKGFVPYVKYDDMVNCVKSMPSVTSQEPRKGHWIAFDSDEDKYDEIKCDCCKKEFTVDAYHWTDIGFTKDDLNFCPNCGADMREVKE